MPIATTAAAAATTTLLQELPAITKQLKDGALSADSLVEYTRSTRNDFLTVVQDDLVALPYMPDIMQSVLSIVSGYFLSAVSLVVDVPGIEVLKTLDRLNANRDPLESFMNASFASPAVESLEYGLPNHDVAISQFQAAVQRSQKIGVEEYTAWDFGGDPGDPIGRAKLQKEIDNLNRATEKAKTDKEREAVFDEAKIRIQAEQLESLKRNGANADAIAKLKLEQEESKIAAANVVPDDHDIKVGIGGKDTIATLKEVTNLSVGKIFNVTFARNGNSLEVPVTLALSVTNTDVKSMFNIVTFNSNNRSFKERYYRAKAGELAYVKDLLFCQDMIDESRKQRVKDKSGFLENMMRRSRKNFWSGLFSSKTSLNNASSVLIVSEEVVKQALLEIGGKFDTFSVREKVFKNTACMLIVVVDTKWETVRIYHRSLANYTELSIRELKRSAKGSGADVEDILKAYSAGSAPVL